LRIICEHDAEVEAVAQGFERDERIESFCNDIGAVLASDLTLGGLCDWAEAKAPRTVDLPIEGAATLKAAIVTVILHYTSLQA
jgi:hypothetical protein